jgi:CO/xanthine dehydrogenase Mo-binding subunit
LGVGEAVAGPTAAALGNALYNALGLRIRDLPLTRDRLMSAINEAG